MPSVWQNTINKERTVEKKTSSYTATSKLTYYKDAHAHLLDELRWLNRLLSAHVLRLQSVNFYEGVKDFHEFFIAEEEVDAMLSAGVFENNGKVENEEKAKLITKLLKQEQSLRKEINQRVQDTITQNIFLPLEQLKNCFHLSEFEIKVLVICLAPQIDPRYEKLYAYLQNDITKKFPGVDFILGLLYQNVEKRLQRLLSFHSSAPLRYFRLIEIINNGSGQSVAQLSFRADPSIVHYLLGLQTVNQNLLSYLHLLSPLHWKDVIVQETLQNRLQKLFNLVISNNGESSSTEHRPIFYFSGRQGVGKKTIARALCSSVGISFAVVDIISLLRNQEAFQENVRLVLREALLQPCAVCFDHIEKLESLDDENPALLTMLIEEIQGLGWIIFLNSENPLPPRLLDLSSICPVEIPVPDYVEQKALWETHLNGSSADVEKLNLDQLAMRFDLTGLQITRAIRLAKQSALVRDPDNVNMTYTDLIKSSRIQSQPKLSTLARKIDPKYCWKNIVLPQNQMQQLRELTNQVKYKQIVMGDWGFANKLSLGQGLNALFSGLSGTGKTMAAEVIANELGLDMYKIDLSAVVSKYIGETEKNLNRVFTEAEHSNAILFFDEADALLGKRSEVKDAHDRYANIEIAYLLQKMEEYKGITILATNLKQNIDEAFTRRIRFIIDFPFPEASYRFRIWRGIWPKQTPIAAGVNLEFMARKFELTGGNIRNIALTAAFYAASDGLTVTMEHLTMATRREFQKMGKLSCV